MKSVPRASVPDAFRLVCSGALQCWRSSSVDIFPVPPPGEPPDSVAIGWKTYVYSLASLDCLARVIDENLGDAGRPRRRVR